MNSLEYGEQVSRWFAFTTKFPRGHGRSRTQEFKGALYRIQILCRRYTFWSYPAGLTIADPRDNKSRNIAESIHTKFTPPSPSLFTPHQILYSAPLMSAIIPSAQTSTYGLKSFSHEGPRVWNSLPNEFRVIDNYSHFRRLLQNWDGPGCHCSVCRHQ